MTVSAQTLSPLAPAQEEWDRMSPAERQAAVEALPALVPMQLHPPEGDKHRGAKDGPASALDAFFRRVGQRVYISKELATYYPSEPMFCPDVLAVRKVETHPRDTWVVSAEVKGLDFVLEVHWKDDRTENFEFNVHSYARLGIPEYFVFYRSRLRLSGWRLPGAGARVYEALVPQAGRFHSQVLQLDLAVEVERVRFFFWTTPLPEAKEMVVHSSASRATHRRGPSRRWRGPNCSRRGSQKRSASWKRPARTDWGGAAALPEGSSRRDELTAAAFADGVAVAAPGSPPRSGRAIRRLGWQRPAPSPGTVEWNGERFESCRTMAV